jgi:cytochrome b involved in lipid metabolism
MEIITWEEIKKHKTRDDCWIVANNYVYDVTDFIKLHPGGQESIIKKGGTDCTYDYNFHSFNGKNEWKKYRIGKIEEICIIL